MQAEFWLEKWTQPKQGWVQQKVNSRLIRYWPSLDLDAATVLVPLCGDSIDMDWLVAAGHKVCGAELSHSAIDAWSKRHGLTLEELASGGQGDLPSDSLSHWSVTGNDAKQFVQLDAEQARTVAQSSGLSANQLAPHFLCGDFLKLRGADLPFAPQAVYDRAALIALPPPMRKLYAEKLEELLQPGSRILLITLAYDQQKMKGPPFSVEDEEVESLFRAGFAIERLGASGGPEIVGNLSERGLDTASESVFLITRK